jgi:hypothetical protein
VLLILIFLFIDELLNIKVSAESAINAVKQFVPKVKGILEIYMGFRYLAQTIFRK